jgi:hypothetical protein
VPYKKIGVKTGRCEAFEVVELGRHRKVEALRSYLPWTCRPHIQNQPVFQYGTCGRAEEPTRIGKAEQIRMPFLQCMTGFLTRIWGLAEVEAGTGGGPGQEAAQSQGGKLYSAFVASGCVTDGGEDGVVIVTSHTARNQHAPPAPAVALPGMPCLQMFRFVASKGQVSSSAGMT